MTEKSSLATTGAFWVSEERLLDHVTGLFGGREEYTGPDAKAFAKTMLAAAHTTPFEALIFGGTAMMCLGILRAHGVFGREGATILSACLTNSLAEWSEAIDAGEAT